MRNIKENVNLAALLFYLLLLIPFDYIFFGAYVGEKFESVCALLIEIVIILLELLLLINFSIRNIYRIALDDKGIEVTYKFKKLRNNYAISNVMKVGISYSQRNSMNNIKFYLDDDSTFSLPTSEKEDLKKTYRFFKDRGIECRVVGLAAGRTPEDYNW
jgi:hypothetical protein